MGEAMTNSELSKFSGDFLFAHYVIGMGLIAVGFILGSWKLIVIGAANWLLMGLMAIAFMISEGNE